MSNIATSKIGKTIRSFPDLIFSDALPNAGAVTSDAVLLGKTQNALEIVVEADTPLTVPATTTLLVEYEYGDAFAESVELFALTGGAGGTTIAVGEIARFTPPSGSFPVEARIKVTTSGASTGTMTVFASLISR